MAQNENTLADSLAAAQRRLTVTASTTPIGLAEHLTRPNPPSNKAVDIGAEIKLVGTPLDCLKRATVLAENFSC